MRSCSSRAGLALVSLLVLSSVARAELPRIFPNPPKTRACCAFGHDLAPRIGDVDVPLRLRNVATADLGEHSYDGRRRVFERNALVYTCRGGFVDLAHVRDWADWTAFFYGHALELLGSGRSLELPDEGGSRRVHFVKRELRGEREELALVVARHLAYEFSIWHEIASWYGFGIMPGYPELLSSYSPEDLYSNILGTWVGAQAVRSEQAFDEAVRAPFVELLERLGAVPADETRAAMDAVEGLWWDSTHFLPDADLVPRRNLDLGPVIDPWLVPETPASCDAPVDAALSATIPSLSEQGEPLTAFVRIQIRPDPEQLGTFPTIDGELPVLTSSDLRWLTGRVRDDLRQRFGPLADQRDGDEPHLAVAATEHEARPAPQFNANAFDARLLEGFRLLETSLLGGAAGDAGGELSVWGGSLEVLGADTKGGDLRAFVFDVHDDRDRRDVIVRFTVAESDALFFCDDRESNETYMPIVAWFRSCEQDQVWAIGGTVGAFQYDGASGRSSIQPVELRLVANPFQDGHAPSFRNRRLLPFVGFGIESVWPGRGGEDVAEADVSPRVSVGATGLLRSASRRWEGRAFVGYRQDVSEAADYMGEIGAGVERHFALTREEDPDLWGLASLGIRAGWSYWSVPENSIQEWVGPFVSDREQNSWQVILSARFRPGALTF